MAKKNLTKKDPQKEIAGWIDYKSKDSEKSGKKVSASLTKLQAERRHALLTRLGVIICVAMFFIILLGYFVSPKANVQSVQIMGANELNGEQVAKTAGITAQDKVLMTLLKKGEYSQKLAERFPEVESTNVHVNKVNNVVLDIKERKVIGYIKETSGYRKILVNGKVGSQILAKNQIDDEKPLFIGYNKKVSLIEDLDIYAKLPTQIRNQVKIMSGETKRPTQIVFVMKDGDVIIGNTSTISRKIKYYPDIKKQLKEPSVVDLEIGAFSRPLTQAEKTRLGIKA